MGEATRRASSRSSRTSSATRSSTRPRAGASTGRLAAEGSPRCCTWRHRRRHRAPPPRPGVRPVRPGRPAARPSPGRPRARAHAGQAARGAARGTVAVASDLGRGRVFTVRLPRIEASVGRVEPAPGGPVDVALGGCSWSRTRGRAGMLAPARRWRDTRWTRRWTGVEEIAGALSTKPDVVLSTSACRALDGYQVARRLRASDPDAGSC